MVSPASGRRVDGPRTRCSSGIPDRSRDHTLRSGSMRVSQAGATSAAVIGVLSSGQACHWSLSLTGSGVEKRSSWLKASRRFQYASLRTWQQGNLIFFSCFLLLIVRLCYPLRRALIGEWRFFCVSQVSASASCIDQQQLTPFFIVLR